MMERTSEWVSEWVSPTNSRPRPAAVESLTLSSIIIMRKEQIYVIGM
jgi:hypothetical protein